MHLNQARQLVRILILLVIVPHTLLVRLVLLVQCIVVWSLIVVGHRIALTLDHVLWCHRIFVVVVWISCDNVLSLVQQISIWTLWIKSWANNPASKILARELLRYQPSRITLVHCIPMLLLVAHLCHLHALILEVDHVWMDRGLLGDLFMHFRVTSITKRMILLRFVSLEETLRCLVLTTFSSIIVRVHRTCIHAVLR